MILAFTSKAWTVCTLPTNPSSSAGAGVLLAYECGHGCTETRRRLCLCRHMCRGFLDNLTDSSCLVLSRSASFSMWSLPEWNSRVPRGTSCACSCVSRHRDGVCTWQGRLRRDGCCPLWRGCRGARLLGDKIILTRVCAVFIMDTGRSLHTVLRWENSGNSPEQSSTPDPVPTQLSGSHLFAKSSRRR